MKYYNLKTYKDLKQSIPNFENFCDILQKYKELINTGKLAEFYCRRLFRLEPVVPSNSNFDAMTQYLKKVEIKYRNFKKGKTPPGMKIDSSLVDYVYYLELNENLLPINIYLYNIADLKHTTGMRVSFNKIPKTKVFSLE
ncbi:hypothetical protein A2Z33_05880 [Candidatus Gottesmanbacteria bacterium RBG_16_52_11]|uniref:Uncharacterized protein n=1 Tax=Candidatus Gottesmanbacteria bacterium RBG_16_52_11 TaxID=1798374 RepID=A0A1F5YX98_9BACT|nr:MAG: hypothetical protein A2Z33_05880 [Candidatus Gottesmanbacteria bacterium RBG_16_52_11]